MDMSTDLDIKVVDDTYVISGAWLARLMSNVNFSDYESRMYFDRILRKTNLFTRLEEMGIKDGDTVSLYNLEFEYRR
jgi:GTP-binding protein